MYIYIIDQERVARARRCDAAVAALHALHEHRGHLEGGRELARSESTRSFSVLLSTRSTGTLLVETVVFTRSK